MRTLSAKCRNKLFIAIANYCSCENKQYKQNGHLVRAGLCEDVLLSGGEVVLLLLTGGGAGRAGGVQGALFRATCRH